MEFYGGEMGGAVRGVVSVWSLGLVGRGGAKFLYDVQPPNLITTSLRVRSLASNVFKTIHTKPPK